MHVRDHSFQNGGWKKTPLTSKRAQPLIEAAHAGVIEPALHGYLHIRLAQDMTRPSEFANRSMDEQQRMLHEGRAHLEAIFEQRIHGFVPPWNSYDSTTLEVLRQMEFDYISASWSGVSPRDTLASLPLTAHLAEIPRAIEEARKFKCCNPEILWSCITTTLWSPIQITPLQALRICQASGAAQ